MKQVLWFTCHQTSWIAKAHLERSWAGFQNQRELFASVQLSMD